MKNCTKLFKHLLLDPKLFPGASMYFLNRTKMFRGRHRVIKEKKEKILFFLRA